MIIFDLIKWWIHTPIYGYFQATLLLLIPIAILYGFIPCYKVWTSGFTYPTPVLPFFGNILTIYRHGYQGAQLIWAATAGRCYVVAQSQTLFIDIADPLLLKNILVKDFANFPDRRVFPLTSPVFRKSILLTHDEEWKVGRRLILPTFTSHKIKTNIFPLMVRAAEQMVKHMLERIHKNESRDEDNALSRTADTAAVVTIEAKEFYGCYTMDAIASTAFGLDLDSYDEKNYEFIKYAKIFFDFEGTKPIFALLGLFPFLARVLSLFDYSVSDSRPLEFFTNVVKKSIEKRKTFTTTRNDYLQLLIDANEIYNKQINTDENNKDPISSIPKDQSDDKIFNKAQNHEENTLGLNMEMTEDDNRDRSSPEKLEFNNDELLAPKVDISAGLVKTVAEEKSKPGFDSQSRQKQPQQARTMGLSEDEVISNALLFFVAGYESTANALSWISRVLAWYPEAQDRIKEEIFQKINYRLHKNNHLQSQKKSTMYQLLTYEDIMDLKYLDCVIKEVLRLHPPVIFFERIAAEDYFIDNSSGIYGNYTENSPSSNKLIIKKGMIVEVPVYALHRDENLWTDPDTFNPGRFMNDRGDNTIDFQYQYMPFGFGPRNCIGLRFALLELKVGLVAILASGIKMVPAPGDKYRDLTPENTRFKINGINFPRNGIKIGLTLLDI